MWRTILPKLYFEATRGDVFLCVCSFFFALRRETSSQKKSVLTCLSLSVSLIFRYRAPFSFFFSFPSGLI